MKLPWFKFFPDTWLSDSDLLQCSNCTRGIWMNIICHMHKKEMAGELSGTVENLAKMCFSTKDEFLNALNELKFTKTATVTFRTDSVTVENRRMKREAKVRQDAALRAKRHRQKLKSNGDSTVQKLEVRSKKLDNTVNTVPKGTGKTKVLPIDFFGGENDTDLLEDKYQEIQKTLPGKPLPEITDTIKNFIQQHKPQFAEPYVDAWNVFAQKYELAKVQSITDKRKKKLKKRVTENQFEFFAILKAAGAYKFYMGENDRGWKIDFDYIIENEDNYIKILEKKNALQRT